MANNLGGVDLGRGIVVVTKPSRSPVAFVFEVIYENSEYVVYYV